MTVCIFSSDIIKLTNSLQTPANQQFVYSLTEYSQSSQCSFLESQMSEIASDRKYCLLDKHTLTQSSVQHFGNICKQPNLQLCL